MESLQIQNLISLIEIASDITLKLLLYHRRPRRFSQNLKDTWSTMGVSKIFSERGLDLLVKSL